MRVIGILTIAMVLVSLAPFVFLSTVEIRRKASDEYAYLIPNPLRNLSTPR